MLEADTLFFNVESPAPGATLPAGRHPLGGWLVPKPAFHYTDVRARVGSRWFRGVYGYPRTDLAAYFSPNRAALLSGFTVEVILEAGPAVVQLEALEITGRWQPFHVVTYLVAPAAPAPTPPAAPLRTREFGWVFQLWLRLGHGPADADRLVAETPWPRALREEHPPFHGYMDDPAALSAAQFGQLHMLGWLIHETQPVRRVFATVDLINLQPLDLGGEYSEMRTRFPSLPRMDQCRVFGFANIPSQLPGPVCVRVLAELADGTLHLVLALLCRPIDTEELKAGYPAFSLARFWQGWCALHEAWRRNGVPLETGRAFWQEAWSVFRKYRQLGTATHATTTPVLALPTTVPPQPRRLLLITHNLNREGAPLWFLELARHLVHNDGHQVLLLSPQDGSLRAGFEALGAEVRLVDATPFLQAVDASGVPPAAAALAASLDWSGIDLVIANTVVAFWGVAVAHAARKRALLYIHESTTPAAFFRTGYGAGVVPAVGAALRAADAVSFIAAPTRTYYDPLGTGSNYCVTPGWIDLPDVDQFRANHDRAALRARLGFLPAETVVVNVGTVCGRKGQHVFVNALELLWRRHPTLAAQARFVMVGGRDDPYNGYLQAILTDLRRPNISIIAETERNYDYFHAADLFVSSTYEEAFPRVVLEAMAFGLPIVSSHVHAIPAMVQAEHEAILVPPGDTEALMNGLVRFLGAPEEARRWGARARARAERDFSSEIVLPLHSRLVSGLAAAKL